MSDLKDKILSIFKSRNLGELQSKNIPAPATMSGIAEASEIIVSAIESNKKIAIIGDYDVDGVSSSCIMEGFFKALGYQNFIIKIPNRFIDGYGISTRMVKIYNADIYISVDNGITAFEVAEFCAERGKILIITDHHKPLIENGVEILPKASVIINPNQRKCNFLQKEVCGAVVAWYLCAGIKCEFAKRGISRAKNIDLLAFTPFLSLAIISDIMPLTSLNRTLYKLGVKRINSEKNGVFALLRNEFGNKFAESRKTIDSQNLAFYITPLLNSAGRVKNARLAFKFLTAKNPKIALNLLQILRKTNEWRKKLTNEVFTESLQCAVEREKIAYAIGQWNDGVIGIVAARIADKFGKSAFCFNLKDGELKGSGRARDGVNLIASIQQCSAHLLRFGGHSGAVGLNLKCENLESFIDSLESNLIFSEKNAESATISANLNEINMEILEILERFEPFGNENAMISFESIAVVRDSQIIKDLHQKLSFKNATFRAILFNNTQDFIGQKVRIRYHIKRNFYNEIEAQISDIRQI
ncbi:single-stranded-DNA-specific exonuclease RecJ [Helicobacter sp. 23-1044]